MTAITVSDLAAGTRLLSDRRDGKSNQRSSAGTLKELDSATRDLGSLAHGDEAQAVAVTIAEADSGILHLQRQLVADQRQADLGLFRARVAGHVIQGFLHHAVEV